MDDETRHALQHCQDELREIDCDVRWTPPEAFHVTLQFLGTIDRTRCDAYEAAMRTALAGTSAIGFRVEGLGCFPDRRKPRVLWAGVTIGADVITAMQGRLVEAMRPLGHEPERRPYHPHVTLGRVRSSCGLRELRERLVRKVGPSPVELTANEVCLQRSRLTPRGAIYDTLLAISLHGALGGRE